MSYGWAKDAEAAGRWIDLGSPCPVCAVDIGEHLHSLRDDGQLGAMLITPDQYEFFGIAAQREDPE